MKMIDRYKEVVFKNYANFSGRGGLSEYWYFKLCDFLISLLLKLPIFIYSGFNIHVFLNINKFHRTSEVSGIVEIFLIIYSVYWILTILPHIAATVRRLHDIGKSGLFALIVLIPIIGPIGLLVWLITDGDIHPNKWGPNPKYRETEISAIGEY